MSQENFVVIGASLAGLRAVEAARKAGFEGRITLVGAERHLPYDRPPLSKAYLERVADGDLPATTEFRSLDALRDDLGVELVLGQHAAELDTENRHVVVGRRVVEYSALVIATGGDARPLPGTDGMAGVHTLRTLDDAMAVREALDAGARTVVVGAGFIGSEVAAGARKRGLPVTILEAQTTPLVRAVGARMGALCASLHERNGTDLRCGVGAAGVEGDGHVERVRLSDGTAIEADLVVVGIGAVPATSWLEGSGLRLENGIVCDENLWTGADRVYAAGDVANWYNALFGRSMRLEHWTSAAEQGALAARNALDPESAKPYRTVPYFWSDWYGSRIQFVGVPTADEIEIVDGDFENDGRCVALYREGDRLAGVLTINGQSVIMKYRGLLMREVGWCEALEFAASRRVDSARS